jgi:lytic cellulose monooxygenase (C1-hydroxylating)
VTSNDVICNGGINPYHQPISQVIINATAGDQVTAEWHHTLDGADPSDPADPIDASHKGEDSFKELLHILTRYAT